MKKFLIAAPLALAAGALLSTPASAASWTANPGQIRAEIQLLDRQIDRTRGLSRFEEQRLERKVDSLQTLYRSYARGGFNRYELQRLDREVSAVKAQLYAASHDPNDNRGRDDHRGGYDNDRGQDNHRGHDNDRVRDHR